MKKSLAFTLAFLFFFFAAGRAQVADKAETAIKGIFKKKPKTDNNNNGAAGQGAPNSDGTGASTPAPAATPQTGPVTLKTYANYDFVPGTQVIFEDNFIDDQDGEFPAHWKLSGGQAVINKIGSDQAFFLTEGNYVRVAPRMKKQDSYLPESFTVEFDFYPTEGAYTPGLLFTGPDQSSRYLFFGKEVSSSYFPNNFSADFPGDKDNFDGRWHHAAMIKKGNQIKCYIDQYRVLVIPDCEDCKVNTVEVGGIGGTEHPIVFRNFRIAEGGNMNIIGQKFTENKIITHGINFDIDKAAIRPESMGTLNMIVNVMKANPDLKFEVGGHTDNTGSADHNLQLSQQRADAVKTQLVAMGVDASRLSTKGFGDGKPIAENSTPEGKANNRRVEFVKTN